ncbi:hypothetical protein E0Z10_g1814 [Xylaria hypoxylon]|uniref:HMG box domain-containing protein n=1 Tax=Xylaria hypoxylon TaxID=37992 RepID=A0A4Z0YRI8_9PEZI|nr:hypothetical protein E0Z10_g1814 [Xylaria hypoxylon]
MSFASPVVFRATTKLQFKAPGIYGRSPQAIRGFASVGRPKKASSSKGSAKTPTKKPATKSTKKINAKPKPKPKPKQEAKPKPLKKPISVEKKAVIERQMLKKAALYTEPKLLATQPWSLFIVEQTLGKENENGAHMMVSLAPVYKALPSSEIQRLESQAAQNRVANAVAYKAWVESHSPQENYDANLARKNLKRKYNIPKRLVKLIRDERLPKKPAGAFSLFTKARWASGDYSAVSAPVTEVGLKIVQEWRNLTAAERKSYEDLAHLESENYQKAANAILDRKRSPKTKSPSP